jgi:AcrR family transcriptional regulator
MSTPVQTRQDMAHATTERLLAVARRRFAEHGFHAASLDALSAEAGVTRGALHHHFTNKAGLFEAVLHKIDAEIGAELDALWDTIPDPWDAFQACCHAYLDAVLRPDLCRILLQDAPAVLGVQAFDILFESGLADIIAELDHLIRDGRVRGSSAEPLAHLINGAIINLAFWAASDRSRRILAHDTLSLLLHGLEASHEERGTTLSSSS